MGLLRIAIRALPHLTLFLIYRAYSVGERPAIYCQTAVLLLMMMIVMMMMTGLGRRRRYGRYGHGRTNNPTDNVGPNLVS